MGDDWHQPLRHIRAHELTGDTGQTSGMTRWEAVSATTVGSRRVWMGQTHVAPRTSSGDHHHGDSETAIHVLRGHRVFVFAEDGEEVQLATGPGDYIFVPGWDRVAGVDAGELPWEPATPTPQLWGAGVRLRGVRPGWTPDTPDEGCARH